MFLRQFTARLASFSCGKGPTQKNPRISRREKRRLDRILPTDTIIASYPRSGNTWLRHLLCDLLLQMRGIETGTLLPIHPDQLIPDFDRGDPLPTDRFSSVTTRCLKSHREWTFAFRRAVVILRNPADALCSYYHFHRRYPHLTHYTAVGIDDFCLLRVDDWVRHTRSFLEASSSGVCETLFLSYEQILQAPEEAVGVACEFVGLPADRLAIARAVANHAFERHAAQEAVESPHAREKFFRQGKIDSAHDELKKATIQTIALRSSAVHDLASPLLHARPA